MQSARSGTRLSKVWGHSSVGRALDWQSRGRGFDPPWLHQYNSLQINNLQKVGGLCPHPMPFLSSYLSITRNNLKSIASQFVPSNHCNESLTNKLSFPGAFQSLMTLTKAAKVLILRVVQKTGAGYSKKLFN